MGKEKKDVSAEVAEGNAMEGNESDGTASEIVSTRNETREALREEMYSHFVMSGLFGLAEYSHFKGHGRKKVDDGSREYFLAQGVFRGLVATLKKVLSEEGGLRDCLSMVKRIYSGNSRVDVKDPYCVFERGGGQLSCVLKIECADGVCWVEVTEYVFRTRKGGSFSSVLYRWRRCSSEVWRPDPVLNKVKRLMPDLEIRDFVSRSVGCECEA